MVVTVPAAQRGLLTATQPALNLRTIESSSRLRVWSLRRARKLLTDAAPAPVMAANDELCRLRAEIEELRKKNDELQDVNRDLWDENEELRGAVHSLDKRNARCIHDARKEGVARLRAEDQLDEERREYHRYREQTHQHELARMGAARSDPFPSSSSDDSSSSSSSNGPSRKRRRRSMSPASRHEAKARAICNKATDDYFDEIRTSHAKHKATTALARERRDDELRDRELQRALEGIEYCHHCRASPCRCNGRSHHRCPEANRDLAVEAARMRAEADLAEARLQKERAEDALADYRASRPKRARVEGIEDAAAPEPKRVRAMD